MRILLLMFALVLNLQGIELEQIPLHWNVDGQRVWDLRGVVDLPPRATNEVLAIQTSDGLILEGKITATDVGSTGLATWNVESKDVAKTNVVVLRVIGPPPTIEYVGWLREDGEWAWIDEAHVRGPNRVHVKTFGKGALYFNAGMRAPDGDRRSGPWEVDASPQLNNAVYTAELISLGSLISILNVGLRPNIEINGLELLDPLWWPAVSPAFIGRGTAMGVVFRSLFAWQAPYTNIHITFPPHTRGLDLTRGEILDVIVPLNWWVDGMTLPLVDAEKEEQVEIWERGDVWDEAQEMMWAFDGAIPLVAQETQNGVIIYRFVGGQVGPTPLWISMYRDIDAVAINVRLKEQEIKVTKEDLPLLEWEVIK
jgi:hypothetical protein